MTEMPFAVAPVMGLLAATPAAGFALQNGTPTILTWTAPDDGQLHRVTLYGILHVTATETGGALQIAGTTPDGVNWTQTYDGGGHGAGAQHPNLGASTNQMFLIVGAGTTVTLSQSTALTAGAAVLWAEIWGS